MDVVQILHGVFYEVFPIIPPMFRIWIIYSILGIYSIVFQTACRHAVTTLKIGLYIKRHDDIGATIQLFPSCSKVSTS